MAKRTIIIENGDVFNRLTVVNSEPTKDQRPDSLKKRRCVQCVCDCGKLTFVVPEKLKSGHTTSCGCYQQENRGKSNITHGLCKEPLFDVWRAIIARCENPKDTRYPFYGARGITCCPEWKDYNYFMSEMFPSFEEGLTLDRIDVNAGYSKSNCRWTNMSVQGHNKRPQIGGSSVHMGVSAHDNGKWMVYININKKRCYLFLWDCEVSASKAYDDASYLLYQDRPNGTEYAIDWVFNKVKGKLEAKGFI